MKSLFSIWLCRDGVSSMKSKFENRAKRHMKPQLPIWLCRNGVSSTKSKLEKVEQAANENAVFNLAVPGRGIFDKIQDHKIMKRQARRQTTQRQNLQPGLYKALNSNQKTLTYKDIRRKSRKTDLFDSVSTREEQSGWNKKSQNRTCGK